MTKVGGFPRAVQAQVQNLMAKLPNDVPGFERDLATYILEQLRDPVTERSLVETDQVITLLDVRMGDCYPSVRISPMTSQLIVEAMHLHDLGKAYGANLALLRNLAEQILRIPSTNDG